MRTELLFESCPFLTSANVTLSRLGFADGDALWEIMQDEELYRYEYEAPAKERVLLNLLSQVRFLDYPSIFQFQVCVLLQQLQ